VLILVLLLVSCITVMFCVNYISLTHLCFIAFLLLVVLVDVLIYSAAQLQECWINLLTYLLTYSACWVEPAILLISLSVFRAGAERQISALSRRVLSETCVPTHRMCLSSEHEIRTVSAGPVTPQSSSPLQVTVDSALPALYCIVLMQPITYVHSALQVRNFFERQLFKDTY